MLKRAIKPTLFLLSGGALGLGGWKIYSSQTPKTLEELVSWKGYVLASFNDSNENIWNSIYEENKKKLVSETEIIPEGTSDDQKKTKIKEWCKDKSEKALETISQQEIDKIILYCTNNPKTVLGKLLSEGKKLASSNSDEEDYKASSALFSGSKSFSEVMSKSTNSGENYAKLKDWCVVTLKKSHRDNLQETEWARHWCLEQPYKTFKDRIVANNKGWTEMSEDDYKNKFNEKKNIKTFLDALNMVTDEGGMRSSESEDGKITSSTEESKGKARLQKFCEVFKEKKLWEIDSYLNTYLLVKFYCYKSG